MASVEWFRSEEAMGQYLRWRVESIQHRVAQTDLVLVGQDEQEE